MLVVMANTMYKVNMEKMLLENKQRECLQSPCPRTHNQTESLMGKHNETSQNEAIVTPRLSQSGPSWLANLAP